jgi:hypothetical protein
VKRLVGLIVLLIVLGGGVAAAAFAVPSNAAVINGAVISQQTLNSDVSAIAASSDYQCYLNAETYLGSGGQAPPVTGAGTSQNAGDNPTATTAFTSSYLNNEIRDELIIQAAQRRGVTVSQAELTGARKTLTQEITGVMGEVLQTAQGQNVKFSCSVTGQPITGKDVLDSMPSSFVDQQVQLVANSTALAQDLGAGGTNTTDLERYYDAHRSKFDTVCYSAAAYPSEDAAKAAAASVASGTPFSQVATQAQQGGPQGCQSLSVLQSEVPSGTDISSLQAGAVSAPINDNGTWVLLQVTWRTPTPFAKAKSAVISAAQSAGGPAATTALRTLTRHSSVSVDPRYGEWVPNQAEVFPPFTPAPSDVLNAAANVSTGSTAPTAPTGSASTATPGG